MTKKIMIIILIGIVLITSGCNNNVASNNCSENKKLQAIQERLDAIPKKYSNEFKISYKVYELTPDIKNSKILQIWVFQEYTDEQWIKSKTDDSLNEFDSSTSRELGETMYNMAHESWWDYDYIYLDVYNRSGRIVSAIYDKEEVISEHYWKK